jgi:hypothetical protein
MRAGVRVPAVSRRRAVLAVDRAMTPSRYRRLVAFAVDRLKVKTRMS